MTTIREIVRRELRRRGADGLASEECGCGIDDLAPCGGDCLGCVPARSEIGPEGLVWRPIRKGARE